VQTVCLKAEVNHSFIRHMLYIMAMLTIKGDAP
jgi:hypothetical protein